MLQDEHTRPDGIRPAGDGQCHQDFGRILRSAIVPDRSNFDMGEVLEVFQPLAIRALLCSRTNTFIPRVPSVPGTVALRGTLLADEIRWNRVDSWVGETPAVVQRVTLLHPGQTVVVCSIASWVVQP